MYEDLDPDNPTHASILFRWNRAQGRRKALSDLEKGYLADLYPKRDAGRNVGHQIEAFLDFRDQGMEEIRQLEEEAATLFEMLPRDLTISFDA